jgi:hypothetical protein
MKRLPKWSVIPLLAATGACVTPEPPRTVDTSCLSFRAITYAELPAGVTDDPGNKADSPETVREIEAHNAKYDALCPPSE